MLSIESSWSQLASAASAASAAICVLFLPEFGASHLHPVIPAIGRKNCVLLLQKTNFIGPKYGPEYGQLFPLVSSFF